MKYILATAGMAVLVSIGTWMAIRPHAQPEKDPVLVVNHRKFTRQEFDARYQERSHPTEDLKNFTDSLAMRELLIQEAQKRGIDQEEAFRRSMQNFLEQSLIKALLDRRHEELKSPVLPAEVDRYARFVSHKVILTEFKVNTPKEQENPTLAENRTLTERFEFLPDPVRYAIFSLDPGQFTPPLYLDGSDFVYRLDGIVMEPFSGVDVDREGIQRVLSEKKTSVAVKQWMEALKKNARIEVHLKP